MKRDIQISIITALLIFSFAGCSKDPVANIKPTANAGASQIIQLPLSTITVNGSGTTSNGSIVGYLWSLVSGPNVPVISSPGSSTTSINGLIAGTYIFQLSVTDNIGLTGVDTMSVIVNAAVYPVANAGVSKSIQLPTNTVSVTGSGTSANGSIASYLWTVYSGPSVPTISTAGSATTNINGLIAGTYVFQFMVTDNVGLTAKDTMSVIVAPAPQTAITLQPANNPNDIHVDSKLLGNGADIEIPIGSWTIGGGQENYRSYFKFDQSQIPAGSTIISATLYLYAMPNPNGGNLTDAHFGAANAFYVERVTSAWSPSGYNWNNQAPSTSINRVTVAQSASAFEDATINVTGIVQDMQTTGNYGFIFRMINETYYNIRQYASSFHSNAALHPKLVITYQ